MRVGAHEAAQHFSTNLYCFEDIHCPHDHVCLTPERAARNAPRDGTPACVLRPLLADPRFADALGDLAAADDVGDGTDYGQLRTTLAPLLQLHRVSSRRRTDDDSPLS